MCQACRKRHADTNGGTRVARRTLAEPDNMLAPVRVYVILDDRTSLEHPLGEAVDVLLTREDASRFIEEVRGDDPELASYPRIKERELKAGGQNY